MKNTFSVKTRLLPQRVFWTKESKKSYSVVRQIYFSYQLVKTMEIQKIFHHCGGIGLFSHCG